jgi:hypothetical protein
MTDQQPKRRGRPPADPAHQRKVRSIRLTDAHWNELMQVGTGWLEERLDRSMRERAKRQASLAP